MIITFIRMAFLIYIFFRLYELSFNLKHFKMDKLEFITLIFSILSLIITTVLFTATFFEIKIIIKIITGIILTQFIFSNLLCWYMSLHSDDGKGIKERFGIAIRYGTIPLFGTILWIQI